MFYQSNPIIEQPIICQQGDDPVSSVVFADEFEMPIDLTGHVFKMAVARDYGKPPEFVLLDGAGLTLNPLKGEVTIAISGTVTADLKPKEYVYDIQSVSPEGRVRTWMSGTFTITPEVTR